MYRCSTANDLPNQVASPDTRARKNPSASRLSGVNRKTVGGPAFDGPQNREKPAFAAPLSCIVVMLPPGLLASPLSYRACQHAAPQVRSEPNRTSIRMEPPTCPPGIIPSPLSPAPGGARTPALCLPPRHATAPCRSRALGTGKDCQSRPLIASPRRPL